MYRTRCAVVIHENARIVRSVGYCTIHETYIYDKLSPSNECQSNATTGSTLAVKVGDEDLLFTMMALTSLGGWGCNR
jgi:hypothetical protein